MPYTAPIYDPGQAITGRAAENLVGARFVKPSAVKVDGGNVPVVYADAGDHPIGVTQRDRSDTDAIAIYGSGHVLHVTASAGITAGAAIQTANDGKVATFSSGRKVGVALETADGDGDLILAQVQL
ncbi:MAG: DUF2190 family protein [Solirubrobacteraceae bacterium]|nr:DUF2190 family protein [Solirubrobacteraceae bacterium]